jgi:hypothetical protein
MAARAVALFASSSARARASPVRIARVTAGGPNSAIKPAVSLFTEKALD